LLAEIGDCRAKFPTPRDSRRANDWTANLYERARDRGHDHAHAVRVLARVWMYVIGHCWQNPQRLRPARDNALQRVLQGTERQAD